jgi:hypothetical protein
MNRHPAGNATFGLTPEESSMGFLSWLVNSSNEGGWLRRWVIRSGRPDPKLDEIKRAAAEDVALMEEEDRRYFRQDGPGNIEDDL